MMSKISTEKLVIGIVGALVVANLLWANFGREGASCLSMRGVHHGISDYMAANSNNSFFVLYGTSEKSSDEDRFIANTVFFMKGAVRELSVAVDRKDCNIAGYVQ
jgi:hypothetical protein